MKRFFFTSKMLSMLAILAMTFSTVSCDEDDDYNPTETIATIAGRTENLSTLVTALQRAELVSTLNDPKASFTVFAPTNQAFAAFLLAKGYSSINDPTLTPSALRQILLNHVVNIETYAANLPTDGYIKTMATSTNGTDNKLSLYVNKSSGTRLNNIASVITKDTRATNGVIHIVDGVIDLPTITTHLRANPSLSTLVGLLNRTGQPDFAATLNGVGPFTVFAPSNDAFSSLDRELTGGIASLSAGNISDVLRYHVVPVKVLSGAITDGQVVPTTLAPQTFRVNTTGGLKITDARSRITDIGTVNIEATNGVIHAVNKVLLPTL